MQSALNHVCRLGKPFLIFLAIVAFSNPLNGQQSDDPLIDDEDTSIRVLLIAGSPSWEYRYLSRLLLRDKTHSVSCWLQTLDDSREQEGNEVIKSLPRSVEEITRYDLIMMVDPQAAEFDAAWIEALTESCESRGVGLIYQAGPSNSPEFLSLNRLAKFRELLKIKVTDSFLESPVDPEPASIQIVREYAGYSFVDFDVDAEVTRQIWNRMPKIYWHLPVQSTDPKSFVLQKVAGLDRPLILSRRCDDARKGDGNIVFIAYNSTWRFRSIGKAAEFFDRFWMQAIPFAAGKRDQIHPLPDEEEWKWSDENTSLLYYMQRSPNQYKISFVRPQDNEYEVEVQIARGDETLHKWMTHYEGNFAFSASRVFYTVHWPSSSGCQLVAYDLDQRKKLWQVHLKGRGAVDHSKWRNRVNLEAREDCVVVYGKESDGRYIEKVDLKSGETTYHRQLERE